jgi:perosamine synthetase
LLIRGTAALFVALRATGARNVAIPALTMIATATAAELAGCEIIFVSNNEIPKEVDTYVHVSLNGRDCGIEEVIKKYPNITIVEDACQSFGSKYKGKFLGTFGKVGCFSFSPHKIISAGNGGCVVTNDDDIAREVKRLKNFGRESGGADQHEYIGYNFKFTDIQAQFVLPQFREIESRIEKKKKIYARYYSKVENIMRPHSGTPWFVDVYVDNRDAFVSYLKEKGIGTRNMYPLVPTQKPFASYKTYGTRAQDEAYSKRGVWLPSSLSLTEEQIDYVIEAIKAFK